MKLFPAHAILAHIVDYAGTFPPAGLALATRCRPTRARASGVDAWLLGRLCYRCQSSTHLKTPRGAIPDDGNGASSGARSAGGPAASHIQHAMGGRASVASVEFRRRPADIAGLMHSPAVGRRHSSRRRSTPISRFGSSFSAAGAAAKVRAGAPRGRHSELGGAGRFSFACAQADWLSKPPPAVITRASCYALPMSGRVTAVITAF